MGFEPTKELLLYTLSKRAPSTTRTPLLDLYILSDMGAKFCPLIKLRH